MSYAAVAKPAWEDAIPGPNRIHLDRLTGALGIFQHAHGRDPALEHGYCTDDVARALVVDCAHHARTRDPAIGVAIERDLAFLEQAYSFDSGRFRNLRSADGDWLDEAGTEDSHGRAIFGLAYLLRHAPSSTWAELADALLIWALPAALELRYARPTAYATLGCLLIPPDARASRRSDGVLEYAAMWLERMMDAPHADWPWPDEVVTYDNGALPRALIEAGRYLRRPRMLGLGLRSLDWLFGAQTVSGQLRPIGNRGWWPRDGMPARYDQQPIEAASLLEAALAAWRATGEPVWEVRSRMAFGWFLGANDNGVAMADPEDGSCQDGLAEGGPNGNRGAESTLAWLMSVESMAAFDQERPATAVRR